MKVNKKRIVTLVIALALILAMTATAYAATTAEDGVVTQWTDLTDEQKAEIYALVEDQGDIQSQIIDKYLEWGLVDADTATTMKEQMADRNTQLREDGTMPMFGGGGFHGGMGGPGGPKGLGTCPVIDTDSESI